MLWNPDSELLFDYLINILSIITMSILKIKIKHTLYRDWWWWIGEEVNFGDCKGEIGLRRPTLWYSFDEVKSSKTYESIPS